MKLLKRISIFIFVIILSFSCNNTTSKQSIDWTGIWNYENEIEYLNFTLTLSEKNNNTFNCTIEQIGLQSYYLLDCKAVENEDTIKIYFEKTLDGGFYQENFIEINKPILSLTTSESNIITIWNQLIGGESNSKCFEKE